MEKTGAREAQKPAKVGCLPFLLGALLGFVIAFLWSRSQVHTMGSGHVILGESRMRLVFTHSMLGAVFGGLMVTLVVMVRRKLKGSNASPPDKHEDSQ